MKFPPDLNFFERILWRLHINPRYPVAHLRHRLWKLFHHAQARAINWKSTHCCHVFDPAGEIGFLNNKPLILSPEQDVLLMSLIRTYPQYDELLKLYLRGTPDMYPMIKTALQQERESICKPL